MFCLKLNFALNQRNTTNKYRLQSKQNHDVYHDESLFRLMQSAGMQEARGMFTRILGNLLEDLGNVIILTFLEMFKKITGNVREDSGQCSRRFLEVLSRILGIVQEDSRECLERSRRMFKRNSGNVFNFKSIKITFYKY